MAEIDLVEYNPQVFTRTNTLPSLGNLGSDDDDDDAALADEYAEQQRRLTEAFPTVPTGALRACQRLSVHRKLRRRARSRIHLPARARPRLAAGGALDAHALSAFFSRRWCRAHALPHRRGARLHAAAACATGRVGRLAERLRRLVDRQAAHARRQPPGPSACARVPRQRWGAQWALWSAATHGGLRLRG